MKIRTLFYPFFDVFVGVVTVIVIEVCFVCKLGHLLVWTSGFAFGCVDNWISVITFQLLRNCVVDVLSLPCLASLFIDLNVLLKN